MTNDHPQGPDATETDDAEAQLWDEYTSMVMADLAEEGLRPGMPLSSPSYRQREAAHIARVEAELRLLRDE